MKLSLLLSLPAWLRVACVQAAGDTQRYDSAFEGGGVDQETLQAICPDYTRYAVHQQYVTRSLSRPILKPPSKPYSEGPLKLPSQRPHQYCRKYTSPAVEKVIEDLYPQFKDRDLAQIFRNAFPNTLDTTVRWYVDGVNTHAPKTSLLRDRGRWQGAHSFIVTGDIDAEWLRDSTNQLSQYQSLASTAEDLSNLILGAINTQVEYVLQSPYCNAFQPPSPSRLSPAHSGQDDIVHPAYEPTVVFECKYELDSLANFLSLGNQYHASTKSNAFLTTRWFKALDIVLRTLDEQSRPTFNPETHAYERNVYTFSRTTRMGTETLNLGGIGNPLANGTGLIRSAFRPSDDATTFGFLIPANAMMSVELHRTASILETFAPTLPQAQKDIVDNLVSTLYHRASSIRAGILKHAIVQHPSFGKVFAYEIDGYSSHLLMDDANVPSLLSLPLLGFVNLSSPKEEWGIYQNTRRMILSPANPYYLQGKEFSGIGGPHIGLRNAWPMSVLVQAATSDNDEEIMNCLDRVKNVSVFGLINESVDVDRGVRKSGGGEGMTRSWFAWANSVFAKAVLDIIERKPELLLKEGSGRYVLGKGFVDQN
jgi:uncharacterized protein